MPNTLHQCVADDVRLGANVYLSNFVNLYGCELGDDTRVGAFVEVQRDARIGRRCKISSHSFICSGVTIEDRRFVQRRHRLADGANPGRAARFDWQRRGHHVRGPHR